MESVGGGTSHAAAYLQYASNRNAQSYTYSGRSTFTLFGSGSKALSQARQFVRTMLKFSASCCTPMIRGLRWTILLQFGNKARFNLLAPELFFLNFSTPYI
jgi:hypothetical protein